MKKRPQTVLAEIIQDALSSGSPTISDSNFDHYVTKMGLNSGQPAYLATQACLSLLPTDDDLDTRQMAVFAALEAICVELDKPDYEYSSASSSSFERSMLDYLGSVSATSFLMGWQEATDASLTHWVYMDEESTTCDVFGAEKRKFFQGLVNGDTRIAHDYAAQTIADKAMEAIDIEISRLGAHIYATVPTEDWLEAFDLSDDEDDRIALDQKLREILCC